MKLKEFHVRIIMQKPPKASAVKDKRYKELINLFRQNIDFEVSEKNVQIYEFIKHY